MRRFITSKVKLALFLAVLILVLLVTGAYLLRPQARNETGIASPGAPVDLGITYLPLTPGVAAYYNLTTDYGALVTEIIPGGLADRAGVRVGDVITTFNGAEVERDASLLGVMRACAPDADITLEVCRGPESQTLCCIQSTPESY